MIRVSGSKAHRVWKCPPSAVLPQDADDHQEARTEPARNKGKLIHAYLERVAVVGVEQALGEIPADQEDLVQVCKAIDLDEVPVHLSTEVAYAWDWRRKVARELGRNLGHRDYISLPQPPTEDEIPLTIDVNGVNETFGGLRQGYVGDYKTGRVRLPRPAAYAQTMLAACCLRSVLGCHEVMVELIYIHSDGDTHRQRDIVDGWALDAFELELEESMERALAMEMDRSGRGLPVREGDHCAYCPALKHCPAKVSFIRSIPAELARIGVTYSAEEGLAFDARAVTMAKAATAFLMAERIEGILGAVKAEAAKLAWHDPIDLGDGRVLGPHTTTRRSVDGEKAAIVLENRYGREAAAEALTVSTTLQAIRRVVVANLKDKQKIETRRGDGQLDLVMAEIGRRGGIETKTTEVCSPHRPRALKPG